MYVVSSQKSSKCWATKKYNLINKICFSEKFWWCFLIELLCCIWIHLFELSVHVLFVQKGAYFIVTHLKIDGKAYLIHVKELFLVYFLNCLLSLFPSIKTPFWCIVNLFTYFIRDLFSSFYVNLIVICNWIEKWKLKDKAL